MARSRVRAADPGWRPTAPQAALPTGLPGRTPAEALAAAAPGRAVRRTTRAGIDAVVLLTVVAFALLAVGPHLLPYRPVTMLTGSMAPAVPAGSVLLSSFVPPEEVRVGDVITMSPPSGDEQVVTHRVTHVERRGGAVLVRTHGDGNAQPDPWTAQLEGDVLRASTVLPFIGHPLAALQTPTAALIITRVLPFTLLVSLLLTIWRRPTSPRPRFAAATP